MRRKSVTRQEPAEKVVRDIRRATRIQYAAEEKIRIVLSALRGFAKLKATEAEIARRQQTRLTLPTDATIPGGLQASKREAA